MDQGKILLSLSLIANMVMYPFKMNTIYCGDCKEVLRDFPDESVDLIYIDPPFFTSKNYEVVFRDGYEIRSFQDAHWYQDGRRKEDIFVYLDWLGERVKQCHRALKDTGSLYLHCDWHANAYIRVYVLDRIFGTENLRNEILWCFKTGGATKRRFGRKHETLFFYTKTPEYKFNSQKEKSYMMHKYGFKKSKFQQDEKGQYSWVIAKDWWEIPAVGSATKERLGYPTQKPERLLEKIINASSNEGDLVLDPMCGCGTTLTVAHRLSRQWIGIDISPTGCQLMRNRLRTNFEFLKVSPPSIIGLPMTIDELKHIHWADFQNWICEKINGRSAERRVRDQGIDGWTYEGIPIQVKQSENVGRPTVDKFETALHRFYAGSRKEEKGIIIAFSFSSDAYNEASRAKIENGLDIQLKTVSEILES